MDLIKCATLAFLYSNEAIYDRTIRTETLCLIILRGDIFPILTTFNLATKPDIFSTHDSNETVTRLHHICYLPYPTNFHCDFAKIPLNISTHIMVIYTTCRKFLSLGFSIFSKDFFCGQITFASHLCVLFF